MKKFLFIIAASTLVLVACNDESKTKSDTMTDSSGKKMDNAGMDSKTSMEEQNKATAMASINAMAAGDVDACMKDASADVVDYGDGNMASVKGKDSCMAMLKEWRGAMSSYTVSNPIALADGDMVAVIGDWSGTFKSDMMGMKTAGKSFKVKDVDYFKFNSEGKITEHHSVQDMASVFEHMGVAMPKQKM